MVKLRGGVRKRVIELTVETALLAEQEIDAGVDLCRVAEKFHVNIKTVVTAVYALRYRRIMGLPLDVDRGLRHVHANLYRRYYLTGAVPMRGWCKPSIVVASAPAAVTSAVEEEAISEETPAIPKFFSNSVTGVTGYSFVGAAFAPTLAGVSYSGEILPPLTAKRAASAAFTITVSEGSTEIVTNDAILTLKGGNLSVQHA